MGTILKQLWDRRHADQSALQVSATVQRAAIEQKERKVISHDTTTRKLEHKVELYGDNFSSLRFVGQEFASYRLRCVVSYNL